MMHAKVEAFALCIFEYFSKPNSETKQVKVDPRLTILLFL